jgi:hypothetical protein
MTDREKSSGARHSLLFIMVGIFMVFFAFTQDPGLLIISGFLSVFGLLSSIGDLLNESNEPKE